VLVLRFVRGPGPVYIVRGTPVLAPTGYNPTLPYWYHPAFIFRSSEPCQFTDNLKNETGNSNSLCEAAVVPTEPGDT
jgi:hypothetical protein